jgi:hypothetical protein
LNYPVARHHDCCRHHIWRGGSLPPGYSAPQVIDLGAQAVSRGGSRFALQQLDRGAQAVARGAETLLQQEKNHRVTINGS